MRHTKRFGDGVATCNSTQQYASYSYHVEPELVMALMDARLIIQVLINIINNALTYTPAGSDISFIAKEEGEYVHFSIADNGKRY
ncbi:hypothetical protein LSPH24S_06166 [Lysinibacillus sphaericus]